MEFEVKNRFSGEVQFTAEINCNEDEGKNIKLGLAVKWAINNGADLGGAYLRDADLRDADLRGANLGGADLGGADLGGAYLRDADLRDADLRGAYLRDAYLRGAYLGGADLGGAYLGGAKGVVGIPVSDTRYRDWIGVFFKGEWMIKAGCRWFTIQEGRDHWLGPRYNGPESVKSTIGAALNWLEKQEEPK